MQVAKGQPRNPLFKILWDGKNPFSNKIVLMDEVHNLVAPAPHLLKNVHCRRALQRLRELLTSAVNCVVVGFTATPVCRAAADADQLLHIITGDVKRAAAAALAANPPKPTVRLVSPAPFPLTRVAPLEPFAPLAYELGTMFQ
jgi:hypothetical protein